MSAEIVVAVAAVAVAIAAQVQTAFFRRQAKEWSEERKQDDRLHQIEVNQMKEAGDMTAMKLQLSLMEGQLRDHRQILDAILQRLPNHTE